jgi:hypothetical protein
MLKRCLLGLAAALPLLIPAVPAFAQTAPAPACGYQFGFAEVASMLPDVVGSCVTNAKMANPEGDMMQETEFGLLTWTKATNVVEFTNGQYTWVNSRYGLIVRDGNTSYPWEGTTSVVAGIAINSQGQAVDPLTGKVLPSDARTKIS